MIHTCCMFTMGTVMSESLRSMNKLFTKIPMFVKSLTYFSPGSLRKHILQSSELDGISKFEKMSTFLSSGPCVSSPRPPRSSPGVPSPRHIPIHASVHEGLKNWTYHVHSQDFPESFPTFRPLLPWVRVQGGPKVRSAKTRNSSGKLKISHFSFTMSPILSSTVWVIRLCSSILGPPCTAAHQSCTLYFWKAAEKCTRGILHCTLTTFLVVSCALARVSSRLFI